MSLTKLQKSAINAVSEYTKIHQDKYLEIRDMILYQSGIDQKVYDEYCDKLKRFSRIGIHFHPDRYTSDQALIIEGMIASGKYKNQYETQVSSGSVTAFKGGAREEWEDHIFKGSYQNTPFTERPKYGALHFNLAKDGPSPRFGSCYFLLKPEIKNRATFSYGDTYESPKELGTIHEFEFINTALLKDLSIRGTALGVSHNKVRDFFSQTNKQLPQAFHFNPPSKNLDFYIEAQIHGDLNLKEDVDALIADDSFFGTSIGNHLETLSKKFDIDLIWHKGPELRVEDFPSDFRGPEVPAFAKKIGRDGKVNAFVLGEAGKQMNKTHKNLQMLKYLWHCLVRFGY
ncbi:DUF3626 domain-containing protein [Flammeovirga yaeyamensis]|uniref:DUF3626 domain-containing protein n=1 Tax=Flammeovirga yaeyamensis TaxID=367791 RepID=A0AAX1NE42_9BACT|nr:DUF3626 domain-containing protein [Flammeovirga yaeyamensis]MBB3696693.1 hypothetical protein [Flammeovirga yaeyamensis]NMF33364.1 DUF3626 domain-containing protein [Flammeovirga yaeyamensis]QWG05361.1 DUF3626 domain-containing protein [Flammeovirga yaeyamensis]